MWRNECAANGVEPTASAKQKPESKTPTAGTPAVPKHDWPTKAPTSAMLAGFWSRLGVQTGTGAPNGRLSGSHVCSLSGVVRKNRHDRAGRKPKGVVPDWGALYVLGKHGGAAQKAVQAAAGDFWAPSHRVKRWEVGEPKQRAANVPGMTGKASVAASACGVRCGGNERPTDRRNFRPKSRSCLTRGGLGRTLGGALTPSLSACLF